MFKKIIIFVSNHSFSEILSKIFFVIFNYPRYLCVSIFQLGPFHMTPLKQKPYCVDIIKYLNNRTVRTSVIDIGCGLGDILRSLRYENRYGMDHSPNVINALNFIQLFTIAKRNRLNLSEYKFEDDELVGSYDVIIIVNFIHKFTAAFLREKIEKIYYNNLKMGGEIIFDIVEKITQPHPYSHSVEDLNKNINVKIKVIGRYLIYLPDHNDLFRQIISFKKV